MSLISLVHTFNLLQFFIRRKNVLRHRTARHSSVVILPVLWKRKIQIFAVIRSVFITVRRHAESIPGLNTTTLPNDDCVAPRCDASRRVALDKSRLRNIASEAFARVENCVKANMR